jgi:hypothetical protein
MKMSFNDEVHKVSDRFNHAEDSWAEFTLWLAELRAESLKHGSDPEDFRLKLTLMILQSKYDLMLPIPE